METIVKVIFGSHLYGTSTEKSDHDYKGIFMPSSDDVILGRVPKSINEKTNTKKNTKNTVDDVDLEMYSLHYFIKLACEGETVALDMLHVPESMIIEKNYIWDEIVNNREKFYTKNLKAFVGYARRQAAKYGVKGSRLNDARRVLDCLNGVNDTTDLCKLYHIWDILPEGEHIFKHPVNQNGERMYEVCGRKIGEKVFVKYAIEVVKTFCDNYGDRVRMAANNEGIDWKAISHAFRAAFQVKQLLTEGTITFPLQNAKVLLAIKNGEYDYQTMIAPLLDNLIDEIEEISKNSNLPEKVDKIFWDDFIIRVVKERYFCTKCY